MDRQQETWTTLHDLALVYIALAYGTDYHLHEHELEALTSTLEDWSDADSRAAVHELVLEATAVFLEPDSERDVERAILSLKRDLDTSQRRRALGEIVRVAEADGILLRREHSLIALLADHWGIKATGENLLRHTTAHLEVERDWTLLHDIALVYLVVAHSSDNSLSKPEITAILERLREWQPDLEEEEAARVLRTALEFYAGGLEADTLQRSVWSIRDQLPISQRLVALNDLVFIAEADGSFNDWEREMITTLSRAWNVKVRLNPSN